MELRRTLSYNPKTPADGLRAGSGSSERPLSKRTRAFALRRGVIEMGGGGVGFSA